MNEIKDLLDAGRWTVLACDQAGQWRKVGSCTDRQPAIELFTDQPKNVESRLYDPDGKCVSASGFH